MKEVKFLVVVRVDDGDFIRREVTSIIVYKEYELF